ncbi:MAG: hypothetical protein ABIG69_20265 [Bacteroidota bacterium]
MDKVELKFVVDIVGHDEATIIQMYNDWLASPFNYRNTNSSRFDAQVSGEEYEPYFGWCDIGGCENEGCSGGNAWRDTGYWTVCTNHADDYRQGKQQPKMKQKAIYRENRRDKKTGYLPNDAEAVV